MSRKRKKGLDYEIVQDPDGEEFMVWTPDYDIGGVLGIGATKQEAIRDAIATMGEAIVEMARALKLAEKESV